MRRTVTFFEKFTKKQVGAEDIHEYIDRWHKAVTIAPVYEYLGLTEDQYALFIRHPENLRK